MEVYDCDMCVGTFETEESLEDHIAAFHMKVFIFHCKLCTYNTYSGLKFGLHLTTEHQMEAPVSKEEVLRRKMTSKIRPARSGEGEEETF